MKETRQEMVIKVVRGEAETIAEFYVEDVNFNMGLEGCHAHNKPYLLNKSLFNPEDSSLAQV